jgi:clumping factor B
MVTVLFSGSLLSCEQRVIEGGLEFGAVSGEVSDAETEPASGEEAPFDGSSGEDTGSALGADTGADADAASDTESDAEGDTESDAEGDTESDAEGDTESDTEEDTESDTEDDTEEDTTEGVEVLVELTSDW